MSDPDPLSIVPGLTMDAHGVASVDAPLGGLLIELALELEDAVSAPVDVEHILAAIVLAARRGELSSHTPLREVSGLAEILRKQLTVLFSQHRGPLGADD